MAKTSLRAGFLDLTTSVCLTVPNLCPLVEDWHRYCGSTHLSLSLFSFLLSLSLSLSPLSLSLSLPPPLSLSFSPSFSSLSFSPPLSLLSPPSLSISLFLPFFLLSLVLPPLSLFSSPFSLSFSLFFPFVLLSLSLSLCLSVLVGQSHWLTDAMYNCEVASRQWEPSALPF